MLHDDESDWRAEDEESCDNDDVCPHCGESIYGDSERCPQCGSYLNASEEACQLPPRRHPWLIVVGVLLCLAIFAVWIFGGNW